MKTITLPLAAEQFPVNLVPSLLVPAMVDCFRESNDAVTLVKVASIAALCGGS